MHDLEHEEEYRYRRISPYKNIDCDAVYKIEIEGFDIEAS
ncbi:DUF6695 family protein [Winogradskyella sp.]